MVETIQWTDDGVVMIDQTRLPREQVFVTCKDYREVAEAIRSMIIRGAPAIGVAAAMGVAIGRTEVRRSACGDGRDLLHAGQHAADGGESVLGYRPDAEALRPGEGRPIEEIRAALVREAKQVYLEDIAINRAIGRNGADLVPDGKTVLTHCNAGALATAGFGTALGCNSRGGGSGQEDRRIRR